MIPAEDLKVSSFPIGPQGGQHAGSPPVGLEVVHLPSGTVARVSVGRSQHVQRMIAVNMIEAAITHPRFEL